MSEQVDPRFFEQIMELKDSKYSIKIWHPSHFQHMHLNEFDQKSFKLVPNYLQYLQKNVQSGIALSGFVEDQCYAMWGLAPLHAGVAEGWLLPSKYISKYKYTFHRATKNFLVYMMAHWKLHRLQGIVDSNNLAAIKWAEVLSYKKEGVLKRYGVDQTDFIMYSRTYKD
jgi:hypothetical protein|tara:strand:- start:40 stop:546 length:507 start_codon:yes stop_codon:yes gene_type:complete